MLKIKVYNMEGAATGEMELNAAVFGVKANPQLVQLVVRAQQANAFVPYAHTKDRSDVRGGGKKPWRQKGTGRARHGSSRSPLWRGGGITFGPTKDRRLQKKVNQKEKRQALFMVLSDKATTNRLVVLEGWQAVSGKTKQIAALLAKLPTKKQSTLIASGAKDVNLVRATRNMLRVQTTLADSLNVIDLLKHKFLLIDKSGVAKIIAHFQ